jgi:predicted nucleic acid-binding protein
LPARRVNGWRHWAARSRNWRASRDGERPEEVLADTSVWKLHFRYGLPTLADRLGEGLILVHPLVSGELACGNLKNRRSILSDFQVLPSAKPASDEEVLQLIEDRRLWGRGLGWVDVHLLASALLSHCGLWTLDKKLLEAAKELGVSAGPTAHGTDD